MEVEPQKGVEDSRFACCGHVSSRVDDCFEPRTVSIQEGSDSGSRTSVIMHVGIWFSSYLQQGSRARK